MKSLIKKILLTGASVFLIWQSYELLTNIQHVETDSWFLILFIAWIINLFITGIFAFIGFAFPTQKLMPDAYYRVHNPERLKKTCSTIRIDLFRRFLLVTFWRGQKQRQQYFNGKRSGLDILSEKSMKSEFGHLIPFILLSGISFYFVFTGMCKLGLFTLLINLIGNLYPILLQRHHRMRIRFIMDRRSLK